MVDPVPVLYVHHRPELGGAPTSLRFLMEGLDRARYTPHVLCPPGPAADSFEHVAETVTRAPVAEFVHVIDSKYSGLRWGLLALHAMKLPAHRKALRRAIGKTGAGIVHLNESTLAPSAWIAKSAGTPVVWHTRHVLGEGRRRAWIHGWMRDLADARICIDEDVRRCLEGVPDVRVVHNSLELSKYRPNGARKRVRAELGIPEEHTCVAMVGRLTRAKGAHDFLRAIELLPPAALARTTFVIVGGSRYPPEFFQTPKGRILKAAGLVQDDATSAHSLARRSPGLVKLLDFYGDMPSFYDAVDVVAFPSRLAGIGRPGFEAQACGKPIVATTVSGGSDVVIHEKTGLLVPQGDPGALADALYRLIVDPDHARALGAAGIEHARSEFDHRANAARVMAIYDEVLARRGRP